MGNFMGHILPGSMFVIFSTLWAIDILRFYFLNLKRHHGNFKSKKFNKLIELIVLIVILPIAMLGEYLTSFDGYEMCADNIQHITMYLSFFVVSIVNLIEIYSLSPLPTIIDSLYGFAFGVETLLLYFHTHGQGPIEQHFHKLLTLASFMCSLTSFLSYIFRKDVIVQLSKTLFVLLQGTWFIQIAFSLYSATLSIFPIKRKHNHDHRINTMNQTSADHYSHHSYSSHHIMIITVYFCWHFTLCFIFIYLLSYICRKKFCRQPDLLNQKYQRLLKETVHDQELVN